MVTVLTGGAMNVLVVVHWHGGGIANGDATAAEIAASLSVHEPQAGDACDATTQRGQVGRGRAHGVGELEHVLFLASGYVLQAYGGGTLGEEVVDLDKLVTSFHWQGLRA